MPPPKIIETAKYGTKEDRHETPWVEPDVEVGDIEAEAATYCTLLAFIQFPHRV
jgi:hypothetical protein